MISATAVYDEVIVRVMDDGPGFPKEETNRLFELFYRAPGTAGTASGAGIGISLPRSIRSRWVVGSGRRHGRRAVPSSGSPSRELERVAAGPSDPAAPFDRDREEGDGQGRSSPR